MYMAAKIIDNYAIASKHTTSKDEAFLFIRKSLEDYFPSATVYWIIREFVLGTRHYYKFTTPDNCIISVQLLEI